MSPHLFCCPNIKPTHLPKPEHEQTFNEFTKWAVTTINNKAEPAPPADASLCIQLVQQIPNGPLESIRYFVNDQGPDFEEISEDGIVNANFVKSHE